MRVETLIEGQATVLSLTAEQAKALSTLGRRFSAQSVAWREGTDIAAERSAVECEPYGAGTWRVKVPNAVGVLCVPDLQIVVEPKIPMTHLLYLFERSGSFPRLDQGQAELSTAAELWPLVASWSVTATESLLRSGLARGYREARDQLAMVRGRVLPASTSRLLLKGRVALDCEYETFDFDTSPNRVLRGATVAVMSSTLLKRELREQARRLADNFGDIGNLRRGDVSEARPERHTARYAPPLLLATHVLTATGRGLEAGSDHSHAFLIRTPEMVEEALRRIARDALEAVTVAKTPRRLVGSTHQLWPDLVFQADAVGDVKYKVWLGDWDRADLYQLTAYATGYGVAHGVRLGFASATHDAEVSIGPVRLTSCDWPYGLPTTPLEAEASLVRQLQDWWATVSLASA